MLPQNTIVAMRIYTCFSFQGAKLQRDKGTKVNLESTF